MLLQMLGNLCLCLSQLGIAFTLQVVLSLRGTLLAWRGLCDMSIIKS